MAGPTYYAERVTVNDRDLTTSLTRPSSSQPSLFEGRIFPVKKTALFAGIPPLDEAILCLKTGSHPPGWGEPPFGC